MGSECKHKVAVYYALAEMKKEKSHAGSVIDLGKYIKKKDSFEKESLECRIRPILSALSKEAENASSRNGYKQVCGHIKLLSKAGGTEQACEVSASLISAYPRRPASKMNYRK